MKNLFTEDLKTTMPVSVSIYTSSPPRKVGIRNEYYFILGAYGLRPKFGSTENTWDDTKADIPLLHSMCPAS